MHLRAPGDDLTRERIGDVVAPAELADAPGIGDEPEPEEMQVLTDEAHDR